MMTDPVTKLSEAIAIADALADAINDSLKATNDAEILWALRKESLALHAYRKFKSVENAKQG